MLPDVIVHKYDISVDIGGGRKEKKGFVIGALKNKLGPASDRDGMETLLMVVLIVERTCFGVANPLGSQYVICSMVMIFMSWGNIKILNMLYAMTCIAYI